LAGESWSTGAVEYWSNRKIENEKILDVMVLFNTPILQYSHTPLKRLNLVHPDE
jgi:hypothetical protein